MEMSIGWAIVIFGVLYVLNNVFSAVWALWMQSRRLTSEELQAKIGSKAEITGELNTNVRDHRGRR